MTGKAIVAGDGIFRRRWTIGILALFFLLGGFLRLYRFPEVPAGLQQDEMSEAYESYSLLHTGADRWGNKWPVYFLGWGSGQNVMQSYLTIPVVAVLGLTKVSARFIPLLCGLLTLPLIFMAVRRWHGDVAALVALLFLAVAPWSVMIARNGIENVELPFFLLLGIFTFGVALSARSTWVILVSLLPLAGALYCYGSVVVAMPGLLLFLSALGFDSIRRRIRAWRGALAIFVFFSLPIGLFVVKNYITKKNYGFERWLPFSVPILPITRLSQAREELAGDTLLHHNLRFIHHGFVDGVSWFQVSGVHPLPRIVLGLAAVGITVQIWRTVWRRRLQDPFVPWILCCAPLFFLFPLNISRAIALFLPLLAMAGVGFAAVFEASRARAYRVAVAAICAVLLAKPTVHFLRSYFGGEYSAEIAPTFYPELPEALEKIQEIGGPAAPIYVSDTILLNYVDTLFYLKTDPRAFRQSGATWDHPDFGRFRFSRATAMAAGRPLAFVLAHHEPSPCEEPEDMEKVGNLWLGECP